MLRMSVKTFVTCLVSAAIIGAVACFALCHCLGDAAPPPPPAPFEPSDIQRNGGWVPDPDAVEAIKAELEFPVFAETPAGQGQDPLPPFVYMWHAYAKLFGGNPPSKDQGQIGACVSFGTNNAITRTMAADIALAGAKFEFRDIAEEVTYGGSRVQIGGGRLGRSDGSTGAWAAKFVQQWGVVARDKYGDVDLSTYSVQRCRDYGFKGVPADLQAVAKKNPVQTITQVTTWPDAKRALANGYGIAVCSGQGFTTKRDANGVCKPYGSWSHCMCLDGYCMIEGKEHGHIENSWGAHPENGPTGPGAPAPSGFWADATVIARMLGRKDSWAFSGVEGFPLRKIDWFVLLPRPLQPKDRLALMREPHAHR